VRYGNAPHQVDCITLDRYVCELPARTTRAADALCACTYRIRLHRSVQIDRRAAPADPAHTLELVHRLAPEIVGADAVAGLACLWRRQRLDGGGWIDRCIVEDEAAALPPWLRGRALAETIFRDDGTSIHSRSVADHVLIDAAVDSGVFDVQPDAPVREPAP